jgi:hypothetical protein
LGRRPFTDILGEKGRPRGDMGLPAMMTTHATHSSRKMCGEDGVRCGGSVIFSGNIVSYNWWFSGSHVPFCLKNKAIVRCFIIMTQKILL